MRVHHAQHGEVVAAEHAKLAAALAKSSAVTTTGTPGASTAPVTMPAAEKPETPLPRGPKGETTRKVENHPCLEVISGPRNGMFINTTHNVRRGQAFVIVHKADHDLHIYGTGKDRRVIVSWHKDQPAHRTDAAPATGQTGGTSATARP